jgi:pilus assembly protein CpaB
MKSKKLFIISLVLALVAAGAIYRYLGDMEKTAKATANLVPVLVAREDIAQRTKLDETMFTIMEVPKDYRHADAVIDKTAIKGAFAGEKLVAGEQVLGSRLVYESSRSGLAYKVSEGHRAVTLAVNTVSGVAGYILPNDRVDIIVTMEVPEGEKDNWVTTVVGSNLKVLAVGQYTVDQNKEQLVVDSVTMDVPVAQVTPLIQASEKGATRLVLRSNGEESSGAISPKVYLKQP